MSHTNPADFTSNRSSISCFMHLPANIGWQSPVDRHHVRHHLVIKQSIHVLLYFSFIHAYWQDVTHPYCRYHLAIQLSIDIIYFARSCILAIFIYTLAVDITWLLHTPSKYVVLFIHSFIDISRMLDAHAADITCYLTVHSCALFHSFAHIGCMLYILAADCSIIHVHHWICSIHDTFIHSWISFKWYGILSIL